MHIVQILLPLCDNDGRPFSREAIRAIQGELAAAFGGLTAYTRAPAEGVWTPEGAVTRDDIVMVEVMTENLDRGWWRDFRTRLERELHQQSLVVRAYGIEML